MRGRCVNMLRIIVTRLPAGVAFPRCGGRVGEFWVTKWTPDVSLSSHSRTGRIVTTQVLNVGYECSAGESRERGRGAAVEAEVEQVEGVCERIDVVIVVGVRLHEAGRSVPAAEPEVQ